MKNTFTDPLFKRPPISRNLRALIMRISQVSMLILTTAIAVVEGKADYAEKHWDALTTWANYLLEHGLDPENQLCTDDFAVTA